MTKKKIIKEGKKEKKNIEKLKIETSKKKQVTILTTILIVTVILSFILDNTIVKLMSSLQNPLIFDMFYIITLGGELFVFIWIAILLGIILFINKKPLIQFFATIGIATVANTIIKYIINRPRPFEALHIDSLITVTASSFPSGHAMLVFSMVPIMSKNFPEIKPLFWIIAILVSISRIYLGVHYLSDIVCGAILGYLIGWIVLWIGEKYDWKY